MIRNKGFTLLEMLVALVIIGTALGAGLRAMANLTQNSNGLRSSLLASWSAENHLTQIRLSHAWPALGSRRFDCPQLDLQLLCFEQVAGTANVNFRRVEIAVHDAADPQQQLIKMTQVVARAQQ